ncbi:hypothetical protein [Kordiimonas sp.]|uniref:hypothetical protein n=1 Tax=Kordiimonas sp. TaxID=1970157 RepID=UPI003A94BE59
MTKRTGYYATGDRNAKTKLSESDVATIYVGVDSDAVTARAFSVTRSTVAKIRRRETRQAATEGLVLGRPRES